MKKNNKQSGFIKMIIIIIIAIAILSYYGIDIKNFFTSDLVQKNLNYVWSGIVYIWSNFLVDPATYLWGIWVNYIWEPFLSMLKNTK